MSDITPVVEGESLDNETVPDGGFIGALRLTGFRYAGIDGPGMSNLDQGIDDDLEALLRGNKVFASHSGMNFHGYVWFNGRNFSEEVWRFNAPIRCYRADTLRDLMTTVNDEYGYE